MEWLQGTRLEMANGPLIRRLGDAVRGLERFTAFAIYPTAALDVVHEELVVP